ncbi:hypothetical protein [Nesterenkonia pannonica]|uniref:hypothetical protein n=1 Tax=Nesterenkonia pannonica TaxID=1548602 RepID=UPI002164868B|nr:hypothetical protein [Nesterenkonia pannonica]
MDLSALSGASPSGQQQPSSAPGSNDSWVIEAEPQRLQEVVQLSSRVPLLVLIHSDDPTSQKFRDTLSQAVDAKGGRAVLATIDAAANPQLAQQAGQLPW